MFASRSQCIVIMFLLKCYTTSCAPVAKRVCIQLISLCVCMIKERLTLVTKHISISLSQHANTGCLQILEIREKSGKFTNL